MEQHRIPQSALDYGGSSAGKIPSLSSASASNASKGGPSLSTEEDKIGFSGLIAPPKKPTEAPSPTLQTHQVGLASGQSEAASILQFLIDKEDRERKEREEKECRDRREREEKEERGRLERQDKEEREREERRRKEEELREERHRKDEEQKEEKRLRDEQFRQEQRELFDLIRSQQESEVRKEEIRAGQIKALISDKDAKHFRDPKNAPTFSGKQEDYLPWKALFKIDVDGVKNMPDERKFFHLDAALKGGSAYSKLFGLHLHPAENYAKAMEKLKTCYESKAAISQQLDKDIQSLVPINEDFSNFGDCLDKLTGLLDAVASHKSLGYEVPFSPYSWISKQPLSLQAELTRLRVNKFGADNDFWTSDRLVEILQSQRPVYQCYEMAKKESEVIHTLALSQTSRTHQEKTTKKDFTKREFKEKPDSSSFSKKPASSSFRQRPADFQRKPISCQLCSKEGHKAVDCNTYKTLEARKKRVSEEKLCGSCLSNRHKTEACQSLWSCRVCEEKTHHTALHPNKAQLQNVVTAGGDSSPESALEDEEDEPRIGYPLHLVQSTKKSSEEDGIKQTRHSKMLGFPGLLRSPDGTKWTKGGVYIDGGGAESFIRSDLAKELSLPVLKEEMKEVGRFGEKGTMEILCRQVEVVLEGPNGCPIELTAWTIDTVSPDLIDSQMDLSDEDQSLIKRYKVLNPPLSKPKPLRIHLLIGQDYSNELLFASKRNFIRVNPGIIIHLTPIGNLLSGSNKVRRITPRHKLQHIQVNQSSLEDLEAVYQTQGVENEDAKLLMRAKDEKLVTEFEAQLDFDDGHYYTELLWKEDGGPRIASNIVGAYRRLAQNVQRINRQGGPEALIQYGKTFDDYEKASPKMMEIVADADIHREIQEFKTHLRRGEHTDKDCQFCCSQQKHYLSHFAVFKEDSVSTKMRVVLDGAEKVHPNGESLNDTQIKGPNMIQRLCGVICRGRVADGGVLAGDGEKAYNQIRLKESEKDRHRILWLLDPTKPYLRNNVKVLRYIVLVFGLICSSTILHMVLHYHIRKFGGDLTDRCQTCFYVDNVWFPIRRGEDVEAIYHQLKRLFLKGGFNIRHWSSSDSNFNQRLIEINDNHPDLGRKPLTFLGICHDPKDDTITLKPRKDPGILPMNTKREVVRIVAKYAWDALGLGLPVTMRARLLIQKLWSDKVDWDDPILEERSVEMKEILADLLQLPLIKFPRLILIDLDEPVRIIIFVDASERAMAAVLYIWQELNNEVSCHLARAAGKVAAEKPKRTIVQLELNAMLMGKRLALTFIEDTSVKVGSMHIFSDSTISLHLCLTDKAIPKYSQLRVDEIMQANPILHHIEGSLNPADAPSRGMTFDMVDWEEWKKGPEFLHSSKPDDWTTFPGSAADTSAQPQLIQMEASEEGKEAKEVKVDLGRLDPANFSSLTRLLNVVAWILRWAIPHDQRPIHPWVTAAERKKALLNLIKLDQAECYSNEISLLQKKKTSEMIRNLDLFLDQDGLMRSGGRICRANVRFNLSHPPILVKSSALTNLIVLHSHRLVGHLRGQATTAEVRRNFWLPGREKTVSQILKSCQDCRKIEGGRLKPPRLAALPENRLRAERAFQFVGCDHTGGIEVTTESGGTATIYILLFTCLVTRAVSLTLCASTGAKDVLFAIRRFCSLRGRPDIFYSDNGAGFVKTKEELARMQKGLGEFFSSHLIEWKLMKPQSPWANGAWERMIGTMKKVLRHSLWKRKVSLTELTTILQEVEGIINTRPLCQLDTDDGKMEVLMPIHFLAPSTQLGLPFDMDQIQDPDFQIKSTASNLKLAFRQLCKMREQAWQCFQNIYLADLRSMQSSHHSKSKGEVSWTPKVDGVYLIREENSARHNWKKGRVIQLLTADDGSIRYVRIRLPSGHETERGVKDLYPLELQVDEPVDSHTHTCPAAKEKKVSVSKASQLEKTLPSTQRYNLRPRLNKQHQVQAQNLIGRSFRPSKLMILLVAMLSLSGVIEAGETESKSPSGYQICLQGAGGRILRLPEPQEICGLHKPRQDLKEIRVELYVPKTEYETLPAILCYKEETTACTSFGFFGGFGLVKPPTTIKSAISHDACERLNRTRRFNNVDLVQHPVLSNHFSTNLSLVIGYEWLNPNFCSKTENVVLEEGTVSSLDGSDVISSLGYARQCNYLAGYCQRPDAVMIWQKDEAVADHCGYTQKGVYSASVNGDLVIIHSLQSAFHLRHKPVPSCINKSDSKSSINGTAEGAFIRFRRLIDKRSLADQGDPDPNNPRIEYALESLARTMEQVFLQQHLLYCRLAQDTLSTKIQIARVDATVGARGLLNRTDVAGEWRGDHLIIHLCHSANVSNVFDTFQYGEDCYQMKPVQLHGSNQLWFVAPAGLDLVPHSPKVSCDLVRETDEEWTPPSHSLLPLISWNATLNLEPLSAPALFKSMIHYPASALRILSGDNANLAAQLHASICYSSGFSYDTKNIIRAIETAGKVATEFQAKQWALGKDLLSTGIDESGRVIQNLASPITSFFKNLLILVVVLLAIAGCAFVGFKWWTRPIRPPLTGLTLGSDTLDQSSKPMRYLGRIHQFLRRRPNASEGIEETAM